MQICILIFVALLSFIFGAYFDRKICNKAIRKGKKEKDKYFSFFFVLEQWLSNKQNKISIDSYLMQEGYSSVAIYGMGVLGNLLYNELKNSKMKVLYGIDKYADNMYFDLPVIKDACLGEKVDAVIVTAIGEYEQIAGILCGSIKDTKILSLEDIIYDSAEYKNDNSDQEDKR